MWILRRKGGETAKKLAKLCKCRASRKYLPRKEEFIINYGRDYEFANLNTNVIFNKLEAYHILNENGIRQPKIYLKGDEIPDEAFPLLARKEYHSQGRDIIYIHDREQLENELEDFMYDFLVEYIPKKSEYRVHVLRDYATVVSVKVNPDGNGDPIVRSKRNGWKQINYEGRWVEELENLAIKAMDALDYDFGAVDIIRKGKRLYILEVNSAPGLEPRKLQLYADYFKAMEERWLNE